MHTEIEKYIAKRYERWLDYAEFHTNQAGLKGEAGDVLNVVLLSLLQKDENSLLELLQKKKGQYCELDFFILRMIKFNAISDTAPYRAKNKPMPVDANVDPFKLDLIDEHSAEPDLPGEYLEKYQIVCGIVERFDLNKIEKEVFYHTFIMGEPISEIKYIGTRRNLYHCHSIIKTAISTILFREGINRKPIKEKISGRIKTLVDHYYLTKTY